MEILNTYYIHTTGKFTHRGCSIEKIKLDNETSKELENYLDNKEIDWILIDSGNHGALQNI
jgi:hypothetical protein